MGKSGETPDSAGGTPTLPERSQIVSITPGGTQSVLASGMPEARFIIDPAPEPGSGFLLLLGGLSLGARRRRDK